MPSISLPAASCRQGLHKIAGCDDPARSLDVVFIHGLGGDSWTTWMADPEDMSTYWPHWLAEDVPGIGLWTLGYAASGSKWKEESMPLADRGNQVLDLLWTGGLGERPLAFITHSMGGIVVKQILSNAYNFGVTRYEPFLQQTLGITFIATPHSGAHIANFAELAAAVYRTNEQVTELAAHSPHLRVLHGWFLNKYLENHEVICRTYCEKRELRPEIPILGIRLPRGILVVDETSAEPNIRGERAIPLDEDHISICKPSDRTAQIYRGIIRFLEDCLTVASRRSGGLSRHAARNTADLSPPPMDARQRLSDMGVEFSPESLSLHIRSRNPDIVALLLRSGLGPNTLAGEVTPLQLALEQIQPHETFDDVDPARFEVVKAIVEARPRDVERVAHAQLTEERRVRLAALLRAGVPLNVRERSGPSLAARAMRKDDETRSESAMRWTALLVREGQTPPSPWDAWLLLWAAAQGHLSIVRRLLEMRVSVNTALQGSVPPEEIDEAARRFWHPGGTALHQVLSSGSWRANEQGRYNHALLRLLLDHGASPNAADATGRTPLHIAAQEGLVLASRLLMDRGGDPSLTDLHGNRSVELAVRHSSAIALQLAGSWLPDNPTELARLLSAAVARRNLPLTEYLLTHGCDPNLATSDEFSALHRLLIFWKEGYEEALHKDSLHCLALLIRGGANPTTRDDVSGKTGLHYIVSHGDTALEAIDLLIDAGADAEATDRWGQTPLMHATTVAIGKRLMSAGASPTTRDNAGYDALDHAFIRGAKDVSELLGLARRRPSLQARFMRAVLDRNVSEVQDLLAEGVSATTLSPYGDSALHLAARLHATKIAALLLDRGADIELRSYEGDTPLRHGLVARWNDFGQGATLVSLLLERGATTENVDGRGNAAIFSGKAWWFSPEVASRLVAACCSAISSTKETSLMRAVLCGRVSDVRAILLTGSGDANARNDEGRTALHLAAGDLLVPNSGIEKAELLLTIGADIEAPDSRGETPIFLAVTAGETEMVEFLLDNGADPRRKNNAGESLDMVALRSASAAMFNWLRSKM